MVGAAHVRTRDAASDRHRSIDVALHPFVRRVVDFRSERGYGGPLFGSSGSSAAQSPSPVPSRMVELARLLEDPACPRASRAFEAYCLLFQLVLAVDAKYFGPFDPKRYQPNRLGTPSVGGMVDLIGARLGIPLLGSMVVIRPHYGVEVWLRPGRFWARQNPIRSVPPDVRIFPAPLSGLGSCGVIPDAHGASRELQLRLAQASTSARAFLPGTSKRQRMARYLQMLETAPRPGNDLWAMATVNGLLDALEHAYFSPAMNYRTDDRLYCVLPFSVFASPAFPGAAILLSIAHILVYYPDGTVQIYERDPAQDVRSCERLVAITPGSLVALLSGAGRETPARTA